MALSALPLSLPLLFCLSESCNDGSAFTPGTLATASVGVKGGYPDISAVETQPQFRAQVGGQCVKVEVAVLGLPVPNGPCGLCGRKATLNWNLNSRNPTAPTAGQFSLCGLAASVGVLVGFYLFIIIIVINESIPTHNDRIVLGASNKLTYVRRSKLQLI